MQNRRRDFIGFRHGRLVVLKETEERYRGKKIWLCQCDCGNQSYVMTSNLTKTMSCGCLRAENSGKWRDKND